MSVIDATQADFDARIADGDKLVIVDFWAEWCRPCKAMAPVLEEIASEMAASLSVVKVNVDENQDLAVRHHVLALPTLMLFHKGEKVASHAGALSKAKIVNWIENATAG